MMGRFDIRLPSYGKLKMTDIKMIFQDLCSYHVMLSFKIEFAFVFSFDILVVHVFKAHCAKISFR